MNTQRRASVGVTDRPHHKEMSTTNSLQRDVHLSNTIPLYTQLVQQNVTLQRIKIQSITELHIQKWLLS